MGKIQDMLAQKTAEIAKNAGKLRLGDLQLNKSGTIGTEPIGKVENGRVDKYTDIKLGKLGAVEVPNPSTVVNKVKDGVAFAKKNARAFKADIKKNGFKPMDDTGIIKGTNYKK